MIIDSNSNNVSSSATSSARTRPTADNAKDAAQPEKAVNTSDSVSLSEKAQIMGRLETRIADAPEVDDAKVAAVQAAIAEGRYQVDSNTIAERMLAQDSLLG